MHRSSALALLATVSFLTVACEADQPMLQGSQELDLFMNANATTQLFNVYDVEEDTSVPPDGVPDRVLDFVQCEAAIDQAGEPVFTNSAVPWHYSVEVEAIQSGSTTPQVLLSSLDTTDPFQSLTPYDTTVRQAPPKPPDGTLYYTNPRQVSQGTRLYLERCLGIPNLPEPNIVGEDYPFEFTLGQGDAVTVKARKQEPGVSPFQFASEPTLNGSLTVGGRQVTPSGTVSSTSQPGSGISFSFTLR